MQPQCGKFHRFVNKPLFWICFVLLYADTLANKLMCVHLNWIKNYSYILLHSSKFIQNTLLSTIHTYIYQYKLRKLTVKSVRARYTNIELRSSLNLIIQDKAVNKYSHYKTLMLFCELLLSFQSV